MSCCKSYKCINTFYICTNVHCTFVQFTTAVYIHCAVCCVECLPYKCNLCKINTNYCARSVVKVYVLVSTVVLTANLLYNGQWVAERHASDDSMWFDCAEPLASCGITTSPVTTCAASATPQASNCLPVCFVPRSTFARTDCSSTRAACRAPNRPPSAPSFRQSSTSTSRPPRLRMRLHHREQRVAAWCSLVIEPWEPLLLCFNWQIEQWFSFSHHPLSSLFCTWNYR